MTAESLSFTLEVPARAALGAPIPLVLRLANVSTRRIEVHLRGRETVFDVVARRPGGEEVWRRLTGQVTMAILQLRSLAPGEVLELRAAWDQRDAAGRPVVAGEYRLQGELPGDDPLPLRSSEARVVIAPR
jgi:hypothetical protein